MTVIFFIIIIITLIITVVIFIIIVIVVIVAAIIIVIFIFIFIIKIQSHWWWWFVQKAFNGQADTYAGWMSLLTSTPEQDLDLDATWPFLFSATHHEMYDSYV